MPWSLLVLPPICWSQGVHICSDVSHNQVDSSLKAIASPTLSIVTIVSLPCLSSNLPAYLGSALVKIMTINGCCGFRCVVRLPPLHAKHSPPRPSCISLTIPHLAHCLHHPRRVGFCHHPAILKSGIAAHSTKSSVRVGQVYSCRICWRAASLQDPARLGFCWPFRSLHAHLPEP